MKRPTVTVQHWIACLESRADSPAGSVNAYLLSGVCHTYLFPADTEFPGSVVRMDLFARFFTRGSGTRTFEIAVKWLDAPGRPTTIEVYGPFGVAFRVDEPVRDFAFRLRNVPVTGPGRYAIRLYSLSPRRLLASEYLRLERGP